MHFHIVPLQINSTQRTDNLLLVEKQATKLEFQLSSSESVLLALMARDGKNRLTFDVWPVANFDCTFKCYYTYLK